MWSWIAGLLAFVGLALWSRFVLPGQWDGALGGFQERSSFVLGGTGKNMDRLRIASLSGALDQAGSEGAGGRGIHRAVRKSGVWFPLLVAGAGGAKTDPSEAPLARIPLFITSPSPPRYRVREEVGYPFQAIGGVPPYSWRVNLGVEGFQIDQESGWFSGSSATAFVAVLEVHVQDSEGSEDSARYHLSVGGEEKLQIITETLPAGQASEPYQAVVLASGGLDPYQWSAPEGLPEGFVLDPATGVLTGLAEQGFEESLLIRVTDLGGMSVHARLSLRIHSTLAIVTPSRVRPASPGLAYSVTLEAEGGVPPLQWSLHEGALPWRTRGKPWEVSAEGELSGTAPLQDSQFSFVILVQDANGRTDRKRFELAVRRTLIVVGSREKAGLAWHPADVADGLGGAASGYTVTRSLGFPEQAARPGTVVYEGTGNNFVDRGLTPDATYTYTLFVHSPGREVEEFAQAFVTIRRFTDGRSLSSGIGDPHADLVKVFRPLSAGGHGAAFIPFNVTGPPDGRGTYDPASSPGEIVSLHAVQGASGSPAGGQIVVAFENNIVESGPGEDFTVFENVFFIGGQPERRFMEPALVSVALFEGEWYRFPIDVVPPATTSSTPMTMDPFYYNRGFAGRNATTGESPTDPSRSGGDSFDLADLGQPGLTWIRYIKLESPGHLSVRDDAGGDLVEHTTLFGALSGNGTSGFDLDAVTAIHP